MASVLNYDWFDASTALLGQKTLPRENVPEIPSLAVVIHQDDGETAILPTKTRAQSRLTQADVGIEMCSQGAGRLYRGRRGSDGTARPSSERSPNRYSPRLPERIQTDIGNRFKERAHRTTTHPMPGKAGGAATARRTLEGTISRMISSDAGH
jgi:hypothetical protein